jgi:hypothetical protein
MGCLQRRYFGGGPDSIRMAPIIAVASLSQVLVTTCVHGRLRGRQDCAIGTF